MLRGLRWKHLPAWEKREKNEQDYRSSGERSSFSSSPERKGQAAATDRPTRGILSLSVQAWPKGTASPGFSIRQTWVQVLPLPFGLLCNLENMTVFPSGKWEL